MYALSNHFFWMLKLFEHCRLLLSHGQKWNSARYASDCNQFLQSWTFFSLVHCLIDFLSFGNCNAQWFPVEVVWSLFLFFVTANVLVISKEGASGDYPGCTDMAYSKAISDGADIIDCPVQMTQDGIPICLGSINLIERTTAAETPFINLTMSIPEINVQDGICSFNLTWSQIQENMQRRLNRYRFSVLEFMLNWF